MFSAAYTQTIDCFQFSLVQPWQIIMQSCVCQTSDIHGLLFGDIFLF